MLSRLKLIFASSATSQQQNLIVVEQLYLGKCATSGRVSWSSVHYHLLTALFRIQLQNSYTKASLPVLTRLSYCSLSDSFPFSPKPPAANCMRKCSLQVEPGSAPNPNGSGRSNSTIAAIFPFCVTSTKSFRSNRTRKSSHDYDSPLWCYAPRELIIQSGNVKKFCSLNSNQLNSQAIM